MGSSPIALTNKIKHRAVLRASGNLGRVVPTIRDLGEPTPVQLAYNKRRTNHMSNPLTVTLSSVGTSRAVNLDWRSGAKPAFAITGSSSDSFAVVPEVSLDDLQLSSSPVWAALSSVALTADTSIWQLSGPYAGIRFNSSALSSAALTLRVLQDYGY